MHSLHDSLPMYVGRVELDQVADLEARVHDPVGVGIALRHGAELAEGRELRDRAERPAVELERLSGSAVEVEIGVETCGHDVLLDIAPTCCRALDPSVDRGADEGNRHPLPDTP